MRKCVSLEKKCTIGCRFHMNAAYHRQTPGIPKAEALWNNVNARRRNGVETHERACAEYVFAGSG